MLHGGTASRCQPAALPHRTPPPPPPPPTAPQVVITDSQWPGKLLGLWERVAWPRPVRFLSGPSARPFPPGTCFRTALHSPHVHGRAIFSECAPSLACRAAPCRAAACSSAPRGACPATGSAGLPCRPCSL
jgi:hypothetical protein